MRRNTLATLSLLRKIKETEREAIVQAVRQFRLSQQHVKARADTLIDEVSSQTVPADNAAAAYRAAWLTSISQELDFSSAENARIEKLIDSELSDLHATTKEIMTLDKVLERALDASDTDRRRHEDVQRIEDLMASRKSF